MDGWWKVEGGWWKVEGVGWKVEGVGWKEKITLLLATTKFFNSVFADKNNYGSYCPLSYEK